jgi:hypothetical protein
VIIVKNTENVVLIKTMNKHRGLEPEEKGDVV